MSAQPFAVHGNLLFVCNRTPLVCLLDSSKTMPLETVRTLPIPSDPPCEYVGAAISDHGDVLVVADKFHPRLLTIRPANDIVTPIANVGAGWHPSSLAFAFGRFWATMTVGDFETRVAALGDGNAPLQVVPVDSGWDPPAVNLEGYPILLSCRGNLVLYNSLKGLLYWLREDVGFESCCEVEKTSVFGTSADGALIEARLTGTSCIVHARLSCDEVVQLVESVAPCDAIEGVAMTENGNVFLAGSDSRLFILRKDQDTWHEIAVPYSALLWEAYIRQANRAER